MLWISRQPIPSLVPEVEVNSTHRANPTYNSNALFAKLFQTQKEFETSCNIVDSGFTILILSILTILLSIQYRSAPRMTCPLGNTPWMWRLVVSTQRNLYIVLVHVPLSGSVKRSLTVCIMNPLNSV
jgi:hypothetical protein